MDKVINVSLLGHPLNWLVVCLMVVALWYGAFALASKLGIAFPSTADDKQG